MILMIDNYDSFTYNVVQYLAELKADVKVFRNDEITIAEIEKLAPEKIVISPGPCTPNEAGVSVECIETFAGEGFNAFNTDTSLIRRTGARRNNNFFWR